MACPFGHAYTVPPTLPAAGLLTAKQARKLAFELLILAEHAERLTRNRETE